MSCSISMGLWPWMRSCNKKQHTNTSSTTCSSIVWGIYWNVFFIIIFFFLHSGPTALMLHIIKNLKIMWFPTLKEVIIHDMQGYPLSPRRYGGIPTWEPILKSCTPWYCAFLYSWKRHKIWELFILSSISTYKGQWTFLCGHCYLCTIL
jgi:hypothetical protein